MSDPVPNIEIEDVLSSIRRLVSEDVTPKPATDNSAESAQDANVKLVLTPDFRVVEGADTSKTVAEMPIEAANEITDDGHSADISECDGEQKDNPQQETLEDTIAELEATLGEQDEAWEPDGSEFSEDADAEQMIGGQASDWANDNLASEAENDVIEAQDGDADEAPDSPYEEIQDIGNDYVYTPHLDAAPGNENIDHTENPDEPDFLVNETYLDEDALRDIVSEVVRQELQGALGERITRNVRKLVRREINRVLSNQDFQ